MVKGKNLLISFFLFLAAVQTVRSDFFVNHELFDWNLYISGTATMPFQGRIAMMPVLRWASHSHFMYAASQRYGLAMLASSYQFEPMTAIKLVSLLAGVVGMLAMVAAAAWYGVTFMRRMWWMPPALTIAIAAVTMDLRVTHVLWYPYDLPHTAIFSLSIVAALHRRWALAFLLFALDLPFRETALFLLPVLLPLFWLDADPEILQRFSTGRWSSILRSRAAKQTLALGAVAVILWASSQYLIHKAFAANQSETGQRLAVNLHELSSPIHWSEIFSVGGYLAVFIWLARRRLRLPETVMLYGMIVTWPLTLYFGIWSESRVWLEWTVPLALLAASEFQDFVTSSPSTASASA